MMSCKVPMVSCMQWVLFHTYIGCDVISRLNVCVWLQKIWILSLACLVNQSELGLVPLRRLKINSFGSLGIKRENLLEVTLFF